MAATEPIDKHTLYSQFSRIGKALANPIRLELLDLLHQAPRTVEILAELIGQSVATTSHHLRELLAARLVTAEKKGLFVTYSLADEGVGEILVTVQKLAHQRLPELQQAVREFPGSVDSYEQADRTTLMARMRRGEVILIDVRPRVEFKAGHIPGALSVPLKELEEHLPALPYDKEIVAYCRGPYCILSRQALDILRRHHRKATRLPDGMPQWRWAGLPVKVGPEPG